jgi:hypothetical protein
VHLYYTLIVNVGYSCVGSVGGDEAGALAFVEPSLKYHPGVFDVLTMIRYPGLGPCQAGSLTGAVAS